MAEESGAHGEALDAYESALALGATSAELHFNLGNALADSGRPAEAIEVYRKALTLQSRYADAHSNLAESYVQLGDLIEAHRHWRAYLREDPYSSWASLIRERLAEGGVSPIFPNEAPQSGRDAP